MRGTTTGFGVIHLTLGFVHRERRQCRAASLPLHAALCELADVLEKTDGARKCEKQGLKPEDGS